MNSHQMNRRHKEVKRRKPLPCFDDWEFWRFLMAALSLAWEVGRTVWK